MSRSSSVILLLLSITLVLTLKPPQFQSQYSFISPSADPNYFSQGLYVFDDYVFYPNNGSVRYFLPLGPCQPGNPLTISLDGQFWCIAESSREIVQLNPSLTAVSGTYNFSDPNTQVSVFSGNQILFLSTDGKHVIVFDTVTESYVCDLKALEYSEGDIFYAEDAVIYTDLNSSDFLTFNYISCSDQSDENSTPFQAIAPDMYTTTSLNDSTVYIFTYYDTQGHNFSAIPFLYNSVGTLLFGTSMQIESLYQLTDNYLLIGYEDNNGNLAYGMFTVDFSFNFCLIASLNIPSLANIVSSVYPIRGSTQAIFAFDDGTSIYYDFNQSEITQVFSPNLPVIFANGTVINYTSQGYFSQQKGGSVQFTTFANNINFQGNDDPGIIWLFNFPTSAGDPCNLVYLHSSESSIENFNYPECPLLQTTSLFNNLKQIGKNFIIFSNYDHKKI